MQGKEYRKKATIQAFQLVRFTDGSDRPEWFKDAIAQEKVEEFIDGHVEIQTLEGTMTANVGDWIARGVKGELYPIKEDIFAETYEEVQNEVASEVSALAGATCSAD